MFKPNEKQPDFVIASGVITPDDLNAFLIDNKEHESTYEGKQQFRIQVLKGKDSGGPYIVLDTYKAAASPSFDIKAAPLPEETNDLPF